MNRRGPGRGAAERLDLGADGGAGRGGAQGARGGAAAQQGARVFLVAERPYLGEDICGTYRLWLEPDEIAKSPLAKMVFAEMPR